MLSISRIISLYFMIAPPFTYSISIFSSGFKLTATAETEWYTHFYRLSRNVKHRVFVVLLYCAATPGCSRFNAVVSIRGLMTALYVALCSVPVSVSVFCSCMICFNWSFSPLRFVNYTLKYAQAMSMIFVLPPSTMFMKLFSRKLGVMREGIICGRWSAIALRTP